MTRMRTISICVSRAVRMTNNTAERSAAFPLTITVRSLRAQHDGAEVLVQVLIENGEHREQKSLPLTTEQYYEIKPQKGRITEETYERIEEASQLCNAMRSGEHLLSYGANSVQALARKLTQRGFSRETSLAAAQHLQEMGLIDEEKDLGREVEKCARKLWGARRISAHLWSKGFSKETLEDLSDLLERIDFEGNCASLIQKKYGGVPNDADELRRMTASLSRYGYSLNEIRAAMRALQK